MKPADKFWRYCVLIAGAALFAAKAGVFWPGTYAAISTAYAADAADVAAIRIIAGSAH